MPITKYPEKIIRKLRSYLDQFFSLNIFLIKMLITEDLKNHVASIGTINQVKTKRIAILGNGPSLKDTIDKITVNGTDHMRPGPLSLADSQGHQRNFLAPPHPLIVDYTNWHNFPLSLNHIQMARLGQ